MLYIVYCVLCCDMKIIMYYELYPCVLGGGGRGGSNKQVIIRKSYPY